MKHNMKHDTMATIDRDVIAIVLDRDFCNGHNDETDGEEDEDEDDFLPSYCISPPDLL